MGTAYSARQSSYTQGDTIDADDSNDEFDAILAAFGTSGHSHDGTAGEGGAIAKLLSNTLTFGAATAGTDITITFDGESNDGVLAWMEDEDYFKFSDDILVNSTEKIMFGDTASFIHQSSDGVLTIDGEATIDLNASTAVLVSNDLKLNSDAAVLGFGADNDVTLTHVADTGVLLNGTMAIQFNDASQYINAPSATVLDINATDEVELNATLVDVNANLDVSGTYTGGGLMTTGGNIVIPNAGNIGSASDTDAISISSGGVVTMNQIPVFSAGINVSGGTIAGTLATAAQGNVTSLGTLTTLTIDDIIINGTNIGHTSDTDAIAISSGGVVTMNQIPVFSAGINVSGGTIAGTLATAAQGNVTSLGTLTTLTVDNIIINGTTIGHTSDTDSITIASDGKVTFSQAILAGRTSSTITSNALQASLQVMGNDYNSSSISAMRWGANANGATLNLGKSRNATVGSNTVVNNSDELGRIDFSGDDGTDYQTLAGRISSVVNGTPGTGDIPADLVFSPGDGGSVAEALRLAGTGLAATFKGNIVIPNAGNIGSASDTDAMAIASDGKVTFSQAMIVQNQVIATSLDISGDVDIDGTTNLDAVDIDGAVQADGAITVGVDGTGYDVKFFGDTSGKYMLWDESADVLHLPDNTKLRLGDLGDCDIYHDGTNTLIQNGTGDFIIDAASDIILDADGGDVIFKDGGTAIGTFANNSNNLRIVSNVSDADIILRGVDGGSAIDAVTVDMSDAGTAIFNHDVNATTAGSKFIFGHSSYLNTGTNDYPQIHYSNKGNTLLLAEWSATNASEPTLRFLKSASSTIGTNTLVADDENLGAIAFNAADGTDLYSIAATITAYVDGTPGAGDMPGRLVFATTADGADSPTTALTLDSSQNATFAGTVTINTSSAGDALVVESTDAGAGGGPNLVLRRNSASPAANDVTGKVVFQGEEATSSDAVPYSQIQSLVVDATNTNYDGRLDLQAAHAGSLLNFLSLKGGSGTEIVVNEDDEDINFRVEGTTNANLLFVDAGNNRVGIGTASPASLLHLHQGSGGNAFRFTRDSYDTVNMELSESGFRIRNETDGRTDLLIDGSGNTTFAGDVKLGHDGAVLYFGADSEISITHVADKGLIIAEGDAGSWAAPANFDTLVVESDSNGGIVVGVPDADEGVIGISSPTTNGAIGYGMLWDYDAGIGRLFTSKVGGKTRIEADNQVTQVTFDGAAGSQFAEFANDIGLKSDSSKLYFGADNDVHITHVADTGLKFNKPIGVQGSDIHTGGNVGLNLPDEKYVAWCDSGTNASAMGAFVQADSGALNFGGNAYTFNYDSLTDFNGNVALSHDGAVLYFGTDSEVNLEHVADHGLKTNGHLNILDDKRIYVGTGNDLQLYHEASSNNSYIAESGAGSLVVKATHLYLNDASDAAMASFISGGAATLMHDGGNSLYTTAAGVTVPEAITIASEGNNVNGLYKQYVRALGDNPSNVDLVDITLPNYATASVKVRVTGRGTSALATQIHSEQTYAMSTDTSSVNVHAGTQVDIDTAFTLAVTTSGKNVTIDATASNCGGTQAYVEILTNAAFTDNLS